MRKLSVLVGALALAAALGACSGSNTSGTETLTAVVSGSSAAKLLNSNSNAPLIFPAMVFSGPVNTSVNHFALGNSDSATHTFITPAGDLAITRTVKNSAQSQPSVTGKSGSTCSFKFRAGTGTYVVNGSKSTGKFAGATGHGNYSISFVAEADLLAGKTTCSDNNTGSVIAKGAAITFRASGPLTIKS
jgi:hypothetical protein